MKFIFAFLFALALSINGVSAQICPCYDENGNPTGATDCCPAGDPVPIQGIPLLIGAGIIYGIIKTRKKFLENKKVS